MFPTIMGSFTTNKGIRIFATLSILHILSTIPQSAAQSVYQGVIVDKDTKQGIPYASIGLVKSNIGVNADENGAFVLTATRPKAADSFLVSCVGYYPLKRAVTASPDDNIRIELAARINQLKEFTFSSRTEPTCIVLNDFREESHSYQGINDSTLQLAQLFTAPVGQMNLYAVEIRTGLGIFYRKRSRFRIRVYDVDSATGEPGLDLLHSVVEVAAEQTLNYIDLEGYHVRLPHPNFFVSVEVIRLPENEDANDIMEEQPSGNWDPMENTSERPRSYRPSIALVKTVCEGCRIWFLNYNGVWEHSPRELPIETAAIRAIVKY